MHCLGFNMPAGQAVPCLNSGCMFASTADQLPAGMPTGSGASQSTNKAGLGLGSSCACPQVWSSP